MSLFKNKHYLIFARDDFSRCIKNKVIRVVIAETITKFIYEDILYRHDYVNRFVMNENSKNKKLIKILVEKYKIKKIIVSTYHA